MMIMMVSTLVGYSFISSSYYSVVQLMNRCRMACIAKVCCAYIEQYLLAATSTASGKALIGPAECYTGVHTLAESVHQNCVLGRCANL